MSCEARMLKYSPRSNSVEAYRIQRRVPFFSLRKCSCKCLFCLRSYFRPKVLTQHGFYRRAPR